MEAYSLVKTDWEERLELLGEPRFRAGQIQEWLYKRRVSRWEDMTNLPAPLRAKLSAALPIVPLETVRESGSADTTTRKFLFRLEDGQMIETVLIPASPALYLSLIHISEPTRPY